MSFIDETVKINSKDTYVVCARYHCKTCEAGSSDSCYKLFCSGYGSKKGLGFKDFRLHTQIGEFE